MTYKYDLAVFIGRFQPFHNGHKKVIEEALKVSENVLILIGSASEKRTYHNPFIHFERRYMIDSSFHDKNDRSRLIFEYLSDFPYNEDEWIEEVQKKANKYKTSSDSKICLIGHSKDNSSYYLKMFPEWGSVSVDNHGGLSATPMRNLFFSEGRKSLEKGTTLCKNLPFGTRSFLEAFALKYDFKDLKEEFNFIENYGKQWGSGPFNTVDACVIQSGHVLMIRRGGRPERGALALPGGFLDKAETLKDGMLRELVEETNIDVPPGVLEGSIIRSEAFDEPRRDPRARIITHAYLLSLPKRATLPKVRGGDDAAEALWVPLSNLNEGECFGDHYHIIQRLRGWLPQKPR